MEKVQEKNQVKGQEQGQVENQEESSFENMKLKDDLLRGIISFGFEKPSAIQAKSIIPIYMGNDIIAQAQSGTGKTAAFTIGALQRIVPNPNPNPNPSRKSQTQVVILAHTRELAEQIYDVNKKLSFYMKDVTCLLCTGGTSITETNNILKSLQKSSLTFVIVGTPGRLLDLIQKKIVDLSSLKILILDEADELLSESFNSQVKSLVTSVPKTTQICLFSATLDDSILDLASNFMSKDLKKILVKQDELTLEGISQYFINTMVDKYKNDVILDLYNLITISQSIIYVNNKFKSEELKAFLEKNNFTTDIINSSLEYSARRSIMQQFRTGKIRVLISTDLLARGIDVQQVSIVINYDLPQNKEAYIHRIGRSGRFGRKGVAINLVTNRDSYKLYELEKFYFTQIKEMPGDVENILKFS